MARFVLNPFRKETPDWSAPELSYLEVIRRQEQRLLHESLPGYERTPLRDCAPLAGELGLGGLLVKDESGRYGMDAFKGLGASWAIYSVLRARFRDRTGEDLPVTVFGDEALRERLGKHTFAAATDGNHGRAVAWTAAMLGQDAVIFMPADTARARVESIEAEGARVELLPGTFDDCVAACAKAAADRGWQVIADTAYPGNMEIPGHIITGYSTIFAEIAEQMDEPGLQREARGVRGGSGVIGEAEGSEATRASDGPPDLKEERDSAPDCCSPLARGQAWESTEPHMPRYPDGRSATHPEALHPRQGERIDVVLLPAGVGGLAAAGAASMVQRFGRERPRLVCVEPEECACFLESAQTERGEPVTARGSHRSIMVGLCCATPSLQAWPVIRDAVDLFVAIEDEYACAAMRAYHRHGITSGESGSSTLAGLVALLERDDLAPARAHVGLGRESTVLLVNTEGATDPDSYERITRG